MNSITPEAEMPLQFDPLPLRTKALLWTARRWPFLRGRTRFQYLVRNSLIGRKPLVESRLADSNLDVLALWDDALGIVVVTFGDNEPDVLRLVSSCLSSRTPSRDIFLDIGANLGVVSLRIAERFSDVRVRSYEPHPSIAAMLRANVRRNGMSESIEVRQIALGDTDGQAFLEEVANDSGVSSINRVPTEIAIEVRRLSSELSADEWQQVAIIKMDVEGYELNVMRGGNGLFRSNRPPIVFEVNRNALRANGVIPGEIGNFLRSIGYSAIYVLDRVLYPVENGLFDVSNLVAFTNDHHDFIHAYGYDPNFRPRPRKMWPVVNFDV